jgi:hypothetical protein
MFKDFKKAISDKLSFLIKESETLYQINVDKDEFWDMYLNAYPEGTNEIFRERRKYDCSCCRGFVKQYGTIVGVIGGKTVSIWNVQVGDYYQVVADTLAAFIENQSISNVFYSNFKKLGTDYNYELIDDDSHKWEHFYYELPSKFVVSKDSVETVQSKVRQTKEVIQRSFQELTPSAIDAVLELINDKILYRGEEHKGVLEAFKGFQRNWITNKNQDNYCWQLAVKEGRFAAIRNTAIGTLLINLSESMDVDLAVRKYEQVVAPANYKRPKAIFTKSMIEQAQKTIQELGLENSLDRRFATLEDISIQNVLWASGESQKVMKSAFDLLANDVKANLKSYENIEEVGIDYFIDNILPNSKNIELLVENNHKNNFVSLIAPQNQNSGLLFKWNNNFSWSYSGNFTDSIKESVKAMGGKVDGVLRFSLSWAECDSSDNSDLDAHCYFPQGHIYYGQKSIGTGKLDVDIMQPNAQHNKNIVENITWPNKKGMPVGDYIFSVNNFSLRGIQKGFTAELEFDGNIYTFEYDKALKHKEEISVVTVYFDGQTFSIKKALPSTQASKLMWNINTMKFVPVSTIMYSPNYWDEQKGIGNKHYFFMLENCKNSDARGFYNEFLKNDLIEHKRVFEALGSKMKIEYSDNQLSGLGFSSTMNNAIVLKINNKPIKINFNNDKLILESSRKKVSL